MSKEIARLLTDFSHDRAGKPPASVPGFPFLKSVKLKPEPEPEAPSESKAKPAEDSKALIRQAVEKAREEEREFAQSMLERALAEGRTRSEAALQTARAEWVAQEAEALRTQMAAAFEAIEEGLSTRIANILGPFLGEAFRQQALSEMQATIRSILSRSQGGVIAISGPDDLLAEIRGRLGELGEAIEFKPGDQADVTVIAGDTTIETQIGEWMTRLNRVLKAG
ncbi:hypothetical protein [Microvirga roseola]|uniref:hypothetical protein n=1 Tax=Microvirga roseola TaxID=2883126 RepID=UPI001E3D3B01|nr:hypothetical protein [Microvirga roseola]